MRTKQTKQAYILGRALIERGWKVTCAESCTGGGVAQAITNIAGSSAWFDLGVVTYSNAMKTQILGVPASTIAIAGAVSEPVVKAMVNGALKISGADIAIAVSGIAGPGGGSYEKPVGTVYIAWGDSSEVFVQRYCFDGDRDAVRTQSIDVCFGNLIDFVQNSPGKQS